LPLWRQLLHHKQDTHVVICLSLPSTKIKSNLTVVQVNYYATLSLGGFHGLLILPCKTIAPDITSSVATSMAPFPFPEPQVKPGRRKARTNHREKRGQDAGDWG
jgi:hypothetical protein